MVNFRIKLGLTLFLLHLSVCSIASECLLPNSHNAHHKITFGNKPDLAKKSTFRTLFESSSTTNATASNLNTWVDTGIDFAKGHKLIHDSLQITIDGTITLNQSPADNWPLYTYTKENIDYLSSWVWAPSGNKPPPSTMCAIDACINEATPYSCLKKGGIIDPLFSPPICTLQDGVALIGVISEYEPTDNIENLTNIFFVKMNETTIDGHPYFNLLSSICGNGDCKENAVHGKLYLKLLSGDATIEGGYVAHLTYSNHEATTGFFSNKIFSIEKTITNHTTKMQEKVMEHWNVSFLLRATIVLYVAITSLAFIIGILPMEREVLVRHLVKLCFLCALMTPYTINYAGTLAECIIDASKQLSDLICNASLRSNLAFMEKTITEHRSMMEIYDKIIHSYLSPNTHIRIWSLLAYNPLYIPLIYTIILVTLMAIIYGLLAYLISISLVSIFIILTPLMICMRIFEFTTPIFDTWLKFLIRCGILNLLSATVNGLFIGYMGRYTAPLLEYTVCLQTPDFLSTIGINTFQIWKPLNLSTLNEHLSLTHYYEQLLVSLVFYKAISNIPQIVDSLLPSIYTPFAELISTLEHRAFNHWAISYTKALNPLSPILSIPQKALVKNIPYIQYARRTAIHSKAVLQEMFE